jgi:heme A synthase
MSDLSPICGWRVHPKIAKYLLAITILTGLLGLFAVELGISNPFKHITFTISVICMCAFVLPQANIWQKTTDQNTNESS